MAECVQQPVRHSLLSNSQPTLYYQAQRIVQYHFNAFLKIASLDLRQVSQIYLHRKRNCYRLLIYKFDLASSETSMILLENSYSNIVKF